MDQSVQAGNPRSWSVMLAVQPSHPPAGEEKPS